MSKVKEHFDIIIIGTGAGGGTILYDLAKTGKRILVLERGGFLPREKENINSTEVFTKGRYQTKEIWENEKGEYFRPLQHYWVGGNTKMYGATLLRMRENDFNEIQTYDGVSPSWPLKYNDFEKYYSRAEDVYNVHGQAGIDPTEPFRSKDYKFSRLKHEPRIENLSNDLSSIGLTPFPLPTGVNYPNEGEKSVLDRLDGYPDPFKIKADSQTNAVQPSLLLENVKLLTNSLVEKLNINSKGDKIESVCVLRDNEIFNFTADLVILSAGAINSAVILQKSISKYHKNGIGNNNDLVGRNLMIHNNSAFIAVSKTPNYSKFGKTLGINDFYFKGSNKNYPLGHIQLLGKIDEVGIASGLPDIVPNFISRFISKRTIDFWLTTEDLPLEQNRVIYNGSNRIQMFYKRTNLRPHEDLKEELKNILTKINCFPIYKSQILGTDKVSHQVGTLKFGKDKKTSILDQNCRVHEIENLYVVDGSFMPSSSSVNPALTIMANALRVSDYLQNHVI